MFAQVIPAKRGPLPLAFFDYAVPAELECTITVGQLIIIPLRSKEEFGIVRSLSSTPTKQTPSIKSLQKILCAAPLLNENQLSFLEDISALYHTSLGFLIKNNLLPLQKRKLKSLADLLLPARYTKEKKITKPTLFVYQNNVEKIEYLEKIISSKRQTLILVPEIVHVEEVLELLPPEKRDRIVVVTSQLSNKAAYAAWQSIWTGEKKCVIGTRQALFLPFFDLETIVIDDEGNPNHKNSDMAPRYHVRDAGLLLAQHHGATLHLLTHAPALETYYFATNKIYATKNSPVPTVRKDATILDIRAERRGGNYNFLSTDLVDTLKACNTGTIFLFCHRRGSEHHISCRDCAKVLTCPACSQGLVYHQTKNRLECHRCGHEEPMRGACPACHGVRLIMVGSGTSRAFAEIKKLFPNNERPIIQIDSDEKTPTLDPLKNYIIIGTQLAWRSIPWEKITLAAVLDADTPLFVPEYKTAEHAWQSLTSLLYRLPTEAKIFLQTSRPEHALFQGLANPESWYAGELSARKMFGYPPFHFILKLYTGNLSKAIALQEAKNAYHALAALTKNDSSIKITGIKELFPVFQKGRYWQVIIAKLAFSNYKKNSRLILSQLPTTWKVDPNPNTLLTL